MPACGSTILHFAVDFSSSKTQAAHRVPFMTGQSYEGATPMMSQPLAGLTFSPADRAEVGSIVRNVYQEVLLELQGAERLRLAAGLPLPDEAASLYAFLLPRQAVQR
jgi:hypothetical protein